LSSLDTGVRAKAGGQASKECVTWVTGSSGIAQKMTKGGIMASVTGKPSHWGQARLETLLQNLKSENLEQKTLDLGICRNFRYSLSFSIS
jgi:hypothetical protein